MTPSGSVPYDENSVSFADGAFLKNRLDRIDFSMRVAYLDCFSGISGDMFLGALVDAGVPPGVLEQTVAQLRLGARLEISRVMRNGISATKVDVYVGDEKDLPREEYWAKAAAGAASSQHSHDEHGHGHSHDHQHHEHKHSAEPEVSAAPHAAHGHARGLSDIREIIDKAEISEKAKSIAIEIFEALGVAEARIHNIPIEKVHFHEVGAVDAMVDIVCAAVGVEALGIDEIICSPLNVGGGTVKCAHGTLPVPAPATVALLKDAPVYSSGVLAELVTPTGAAIVKVLVRRFAAFPEMTIAKTGYGAGSREIPGLPNVLRLTVGAPATAVSAHVTGERVTVLEANLDDLNPQVFGYVLDRLLEEGALDAFAVPIQMKKNRPGTLLTVLCNSDQAAKLTEIIFQETTTLGVRRREEARQCLARRWENVRTQWGEVRIKIASMNGSITNYAPEYEDCRKIAAEHRVPLKTVMQEAARIYLSLGH
ncbi:MAG TPA: nickel pincer cofactor biosynthesis protein LarC [Verrucomicrobiae bacterium]|nr:nickel pincer cofactor biosynthesis protein LarC [Verrucomicrobiae bacterium]